MSDLHVSSEPFGTTRDGRPVQRWTFGSGALRVRSLSYGAHLQAVEVPDASGATANVVLAQADLAQYEAVTGYLGATVGRYANRIARGRFTLDGREHQLPVNDPAGDPVNDLHSGPDGFDRRVWAGEEVRRGAGSAGSTGGPQGVGEVEEVGVRYRLVSPDGDQGFPGELVAEVEQVVTSAGELVLRYAATSSAPTVVNLTSHAYWALSGEGSGAGVLAHELQVRASRYTPVDATSIPLGPLAPVAGTPFDFTSPRPVGERIGADDTQLHRVGGYDHHWVFDGSEDEGGDDGLDRARTPVVVLHDPASGRVLEVLTDAPGVQVYSGNQLDGSLRGPSGTAYARHAGLALETQHAPDSPNRPDAPSVVLRPGERYGTWTRYRFSTR